MPKRTCTIEGCKSPALARSWCAMHYQRWLHHGDPTYAPVRAKSVCTIPDCARSKLARGYCGKHYQRWRKYGDATVTEFTVILGTAEERFWPRVSCATANGCWEWIGTRSKGGYGIFNYAQGSFAHRFSYEILVGPIPDGLVLDHLCRVRHCVNPQHLEPVTVGENIRRGVRHSRREPTAAG